MLRLTEKIPDLFTSERYLLVLPMSFFGLRGLFTLLRNDPYKKYLKFMRDVDENPQKYFTSVESEEEELQCTGYRRVFALDVHKDG